MDFGDRLVKARERAGLNQKQLAEILDITPTRLNYWEKNKREPDVFMIKKLASSLKVSADYLIGNLIPGNHISEFLSESEIKHIKKYRTLDEHGKETVDVVLDKEYERCQQVYIATKIAARDGKGGIVYISKKDLDQAEKMIQSIEDDSDL